MILESEYYNAEKRKYGILIATILFVIIVPFIGFYMMAEYQYTIQHNQQAITDNQTTINNNQNVLPSAVDNIRVKRESVPIIIDITPTPTIMPTVTPVVSYSEWYPIGYTPTPVTHISTLKPGDFYKMNLVDNSVISGTLSPKITDANFNFGNTQYAYVGDNLTMHVIINNPNNYSITDSYVHIRINEDNDVRSVRYDIPKVMMANSDTDFYVTYQIPNNIKPGLKTINASIYYISPLDNTNIIYGCSILSRINIFTN